MSDVPSIVTTTKAESSAMSGSVSDLAASPKSREVSKPIERFHGLDAARAAAMLLGVFYHLPITFMAGGFGGPVSPKSSIDLWLHSFRMPLFFLISGFFACMMLKKYGLAGYYARRGWRIGAALVVSFCLLVAFRVTAEQLQRNVVAPPTMPGFGPPAGVGATPLGRQPNAPFTGPFAGPGVGQRPAIGPAMSPDPLPITGAPTRHGQPQNEVVTPPVRFSLPGMPSRQWASVLFGNYEKHFSLEHLWFLWYLFVMVLVAPWFAETCVASGRALRLKKTQRTGAKLAQRNMLGVAMGLIGLPLLIHARNFMGWSLANPHGFLGAFPDFLLQYYPDWPHYAFYFAAGWWMFLNRDVLTSFERQWKWSLAIGVIGFALSQWLASRYGMNPAYTNSGWVRLAAFALYGVGAAYSVLGFLGVFQRYLNWPNSVVRYFADTALWVYLVHLPLIPYVIGWVEPWRTSWWEASIGGMLVVAGASLALYELLVRPTVLMYVYGPATALSKSAK